MPEEIIEIDARMDDDFNDGLLSGDKWIYNSGIGSISEAEGVLSVGKTSSQTGMMTQVRSAAALIGDFDFSVKIRRIDLNSSSTSVGFFLGSYDDAVPNNASGFLIGMMGTQWKITSREGSVYTDKFQGQTNIQDVWYTVRVTRNTIEWKFYLDGQLILTMPTSYTFPVYFSSYRFWKESTATTHYGTLQFDDLITNDLSSKAHIGQTLPYKTCLPVDKDTLFLAHYDITEEESLYGIRPMGHKNSLNFIDSTSYVELNRVLDSVEFTLFGSFKLNSLPITEMDIVSQYLAADTGRFLLTVNDSSGSKKLRPFIGGNAHFSAKNLAAGVWYNFCITRDTAGVSNIYFDGVLDSTGNLGTAVPSNVPTRLGSNSGGLGVFLDGNLGQISAFNKALPADIVASIYRNGIGFYMGDLVLHCDADDGDGILVRDHSSKGNHGYFKGNTQWSWGRTVATLRSAEGKFGGAIAIEEETSNILYTGTDTALGCIIANNTYTNYTIIKEYIDTPNPLNSSKVAHVKTLAYLGPDAWMRFGEVLGSQGSTKIPVLSSTTYTFSFYLKKSNSYTNNNMIYFNEYDSANFNVKNYGKFDSSLKESCGNGWYKYSAQFTTSATTTYIFIQHFAYDTSGMEFWFVGAQLEKKTFVTSFTGADRPTGILSYDMRAIGIDPLGDWTLSGWFKRGAATGWASIFGIGNYYQSGESEFTVWTNHSNRIFAHSHDNQSGLGSVVLTANPGELEDWFFLTVTHDKLLGEYKIYTWTKDRYATGSFVRQMQNPMEPILYIGRSSSSSHMFNGLIDELRIDKVVRTEDEIKQWYYSQSPFFPKGIHRIYS